MDTAYCGPPPSPGQIATSFNFDPVLLIVLTAAALLLWRRPAGLAAIAVLTIAFISPLCALSSALFAARVTHHVLIVAVAAPLLAWAFPAHRASMIAWPFVVATLVLWGWHLPSAYDLAATSIAVYWLMQVKLLLSATLFWRALFAPQRTPVEQLLYVVMGYAQMGLLGALLTFAPEPLYTAHAVFTLAWGLTALEDQALGGLIMWVPAGIPYAIIAGLVARRSWMGLTRVPT